MMMALLLVFQGFQTLAKKVDFRVWGLGDLNMTSKELSKHAGKICAGRLLDNRPSAAES